MATLSLKKLGSVKVTVVCENTARGRGILGEHGLAWWIQSEGCKVLFDLGQGLCLASNSKKLGIELERAESIVLSHGHYDHVGGWWILPESAKRAKVFMHPDVLEPKYLKRADGSVGLVSNNRFSEAVNREAGEVIACREPTEVAEGIWMTGEIPRVTDYEDTGGDFVGDKDGLIPDPLLDDQALFFKTPKGIVVILGCAHAGVINTLRHVQSLTGGPIHAMVGGMHLLNASAHRLKRTLEDLRSIRPDWIGPNHCTGDQAAVALRMAFTPNYLECHAGQTVVFPKTETSKQD
jgi:7,8-dihydropterin-6-yl-methyl-4-(beta-D-ribofuranosyl)aminobenzene 5'-phosphate synthase